MIDVKYLNYCIEQLEKIINIPSPTGYTFNVADYVACELEQMGYSAQINRKGGVFVEVAKGEAREQNNALMLGSHLDTLGGMVAGVAANGNIKITPLGGLQANNVEAENVTIHTRGGKKYTGTFQLKNASVHVNKEYAESKRNFETMEVILDEDVKTDEDAHKLGIETGDIVSFEPRFTVTETGYIKSRFLDDKLSAASLLALAKYIKENNVETKRPVYMLFTVFEEIGYGASTGVPENVAEFLAVDMGCVGEGLACTEKIVSICVKDSSGPMSYAVVTKLVEKAKENNIDYALDIYPFYGSDAASALSAGSNILHCVLGAGVYASHGYERSHKKGVENLLNLLVSYI